METLIIVSAVNLIGKPVLFILMHSQIVAQHLNFVITQPLHGE